MEIEPGYVGNLDSTQEQKLQQFWRILMQSWDPAIPPLDPARRSSISSNATSKGHRRFFSLGRSPAQPTEEELAAIPANLLSTLKSLDAGPNELKVVGSLLIKLPGDKLQSAFLTLLKQDHPDALLLRFLRAEKWNVPKAWTKFVSSLNWRVNEYKVDEEVLLKGEEHNLQKSRLEGNSADKKDGEGYVLQLKSGKGYLHGCDRWGRPICVVRVRIHDPSQQTQKGLFDYIIHCIESVRYLQVPPVESMAIVFDLTSFSLSNWDFPPVKFIIDNFQENYPESLGALIFYNAPWIFSGFWKIIHGILDPVVASKVHFINGAKDLEKLVPKSQILKEIGGEEDWDYEYIEPLPQENDRLKDTATRDLILGERKCLGDELFRVTVNWISQSDVESSLVRRDEVIKSLRENYWKLDPYVRARSILDRTGVIKEGGRIDFYPTKVSNKVDEKLSVVTEHIDEAKLAAVSA
ncbi:CRAL/TRIO domain protein [Penicillium brasilianum]|uniref:CRAL/TRIO domain protein n=1 Tax=Penicillium brasilianum TaxID=104259 RepID=A0A1S9RHK2_PENBI|nr:CRAL/TRIO domain protein [Penicillium brasilianum]